MRIQPETDAASIVLLGAFNPRIFRPEWFKATEIIAGDEADAATIQVIHEALTIFSVDWAQITVEQNRFSIETQNAPLIRIRDLVIKTFSEFLMHTPIHSMGINRIVHFDVGDFSIRDKIGNLLAPHEPWGEWGPRISGGSTDPRLHGGMRSLMMTKSNREDAYKGSINARIEPSARPALLTTGIFMEINDHYLAGQPDEVVGSDAAMAILESQWSASMDRSAMIVDQIMALKDRVR
jgi:hypothetical protein